MMEGVGDVYRQRSTWDKSEERKDEENATLTIGNITADGSDELLSLRVG